MQVCNRVGNVRKLIVPAAARWLPVWVLLVDQFQRELLLPVALDRQNVDQSSEIMNQYCETTDR